MTDTNIVRNRLVRLPSDLSEAQLQMLNTLLNTTFTGLSLEEIGGTGHGDNTAVSRLTFDGEGFEIQFEMDNSHLPEGISTLARQAWWRKGGKAKDVNLWYRPIDWEREKSIYLEARRDAWTGTHGPDIPFDGEGFWSDARRHLDHVPLGGECGHGQRRTHGHRPAGPGAVRPGRCGVYPLLLHLPQVAGA